MRSVRSLLQDLVDGKAIPSTPKDPNAKPYVVQPDVQEPVTNFRKVVAEPVKSTFRPDSVYVPKVAMTPPPAPVEIAASEADVCLDNNGKPHEVQISRGKKTCWLCGANLTDRRDASTSWRATVYGTKVKR